MKQQNVQSPQINTRYPPDTLMVDKTTYPNGVTVEYNGHGRIRYNLLPSNHELVLAEAELRKPAKNTFKPRKTLVEQAGVIIEMASKKLKTKVNY